MFVGELKYYSKSKDEQMLHLISFKDKQMLYLISFKDKQMLYLISFKIATDFPNS